MGPKTPTDLPANPVRSALRGGIVLLAVAWTPAVYAQDADSPASVRLINESRIAKNGDLEFGKIIPGPTGGRITIAPNGNVTVNGVISMGGTQPASFTLTRRVLIDYPTYEGPKGADTIELVHATDPNAKMILRNFTTDFNRRGFLGLPAYYFAASFPFRVGGTLDVSANQKPGNYSGIFSVTIEYN